MFIGTPRGAYISIARVYLQVGTQGIPGNIVGIFSPKIQPPVQLTQTLGIFWLLHIQYIGLPPWHTHRVYPENFWYKYMGKLKYVVPYWGLQGAKPHAKIKNFLMQPIVTTQKHSGDLRFLYLRPPEVNQVVILLGPNWAIADYHLTPRKLFEDDCLEPQLWANTK